MLARDKCGPDLGSISAHDDDRENEERDNDQGGEPGWIEK